MFFFLFCFRFCALVVYGYPWALMYLVQSGNQIGVKGANAIAECLKIATCLQQLILVRFF
jgi:hypothetical protein